MKTSDGRQPANDAKRRHAAGVIVIALFLAGSTALAQSSDETAGRLTAYACEKLRTPASIDVQLTDNSANNLQLKEKFTAHMKRDGLGVSATAPLLLMLDIRTTRTIEQAEKSEIGKLQVGKGGGVSLRGKVWSNTGDSVLGGRKKTARSRPVDQLTVTATLNRRDDGRCVWRGEISYDLQGRDADTAAGDMMPVLAHAIGKTIQNQPIETPE